MSNGQHRAVPEGLADRPLDQRVGLVVDVRGRLEEEKEGEEEGGLRESVIIVCIHDHNWLSRLALP